MEIAMLGPLEVRRDGSVAAIAGVKQRAVLATLLTNANRAVSAGELAIAIWGGEAPRDAANAVHAHVSRLRRALNDSQAIVTVAAGYELRVERAAVDALYFEDLVRRPETPRPWRR
jgi:DNA-binding SARP family transcriptional activator